MREQRRISHLKWKFRFVLRTIRYPLENVCVNSLQTQGFRFLFGERGMYATSGKYMSKCLTFFIKSRFLSLKKITYIQMWFKYQTTYILPLTVNLIFSKIISQIFLCFQNLNYILIVCSTISYVYGVWLRSHMWYVVYQITYTCRRGYQITYKCVLKHKATFLMCLALN